MQHRLIAICLLFFALVTCSRRDDKKSSQPSADAKVVCSALARSSKVPGYTKTTVLPVMVVRCAALKEAQRSLVIYLFQSGKVKPWERSIP